jgi:hypothetical protein
LWVDEDKADENDPEEAECIGEEVREKCKSCHFKKGFILRFYFSMEQTCA